jgi:hypothetical protein
MMYACCDRLRRDLVANDGSLLNGIDYLEVLDHDAPPGIAPQQTLLVRCLKDISPPLTAANVRINGGEARHQVHVVWAASASAVPAGAGPAEQAFFAALPKPAGLLVVRTDARGDYSPYTLTLVTSPTDSYWPQNFDPQFVSVEFSFKVECPSDFDCLPVIACPPLAAADWNADYLAKDYASFRRLLLDRLANLLPEWREPTAADEVVALTELFAYVGDRLSYQQDAIATEAYLGTARRRISLRRHALLTDYRMHDGGNARAWVIVELAPGGAADGAVLAKDATQFLTRVPGVPPSVEAASEDFAKAMERDPVVFEPIHDLTLREQHARLPLYTWDDERCCLPIGATAATLHGHFPLLEVGQVLVFEEVKGPLTGAAADADPTHRHAVRLTSVNYTKPGGGDLVDPRTQERITEICWSVDDAPRLFPLCLSSKVTIDDKEKFFDDLTVARGNVVLVDHGRTIRDEPLGTVPQPTLYAAVTPEDRCEPSPAVPLLPRFRPRLASQPLTQAAPLDTRSARVAMQYPVTDALPSIRLTGTLEAVTNSWDARRDLLRSSDNLVSDNRVFVVETEHDGSAQLRFGDNVHGLRPDAGTTFAATYRVGNGRAGNVGAESIFHVVTTLAGIDGARNPLPAGGGVDPETAEEVRRRAPEAFRTQERAVTPEDYADVTQRFNPADIQRAVASLRWTGSWHTVFITPDPKAGHLVDLAKVRRFVERFRMVGHDLEFDTPRWVSLEIAMLICVRNDYFRSQVKLALLDVFSAGRRADGRLGMFHPDRFTFGQPVYSSPLYAAARELPGVASVEITKFQRQGIDTRAYLDAGRLTLGPLEIARLENDPSQPEHGILRLDLRGGK